MKRSPVTKCVASPIPKAMLATKIARKKVAAWIESNGPEVVTDRQFIERRLLYLGDTDIRQTVIGALLQMPSIVIDYVCCTACFIGVGSQTLGWQIGACNDDLDKALHVIAIAQPSPALVGHEVAHCWLESISCRRAMSRREYIAAELRASRLAAAWGFVGPPADPSLWLSSPAQHE